jgi:hypothetical protein
MLDTAAHTQPQALAEGRRVLLDAILDRIGPPHGRVLAGEEYARLSRQLRILGSGEPEVCLRAGVVVHEWAIEGHARLRVRGCWLPQGAGRALCWLPVE